MSVEQYDPDQMVVAAHDHNGNLLNQVRHERNRWFLAFLVVSVLLLLDVSYTSWVRHGDQDVTQAIREGLAAGYERGMDHCLGVNDTTAANNVATYRWKLGLPPESK